MKILFFECIGGASGDMILGSLLEIGATLSYLEQNLKSLRFDHDEKISIVPEYVVSNGIRGLRIQVLNSSEHKHNYRIDSHHHRKLNDILKLINDSKLPEDVKNKSSTIFRKLAEVEGKIHGTPAEDVHFHEVGAIDSIVDIVGIVLALYELQINKIFVGTLPCGHGFIKCAHGIIPNPSPAMLALSEGYSIEYIDEPFELVTPTAAAVFATLAENKAKTTNISGRLVKTGYGIGSITLNTRPNALRVSLLEKPSDFYPYSSNCTLLECNIDDMTPELMGALFEKLFCAGALDVFYTPIYMKKNRPALLLSILCDEENKSKIVTTLFEESTTFGIREYNISRYVLPRCIKEVETIYGKVQVKIGEMNGKIVTASPEYEDCLRLAKSNNVSLKSVYQSVITAITNQILQKG